MHPLHRVAHLLDQQEGVISRRQLIDAGVVPHEIERLLRRREVAPAARGVLVCHTGPPTWRQRVWAALLAAGPAAADRFTAIDLACGREGSAAAPVQITCDATRRVKSWPGVAVHRRRHLERVAAWQLSPPRVRLEHALLDVATERPRRIDGIADLADAVGARRTTADRLRTALDGRARVKDRPWWAGVLDDLASGSHSVLEHGYVSRVERPHGLPRGVRQVRRVEEGRVTYSDVEYVALGVRVELDGFATHGGRRQRERDLDRDLLGTLAGDHTIRLGWGHVYERECWTAGVVGRALAARGWAGAPRRCSSACLVAEVRAA